MLKRHKSKTFLSQRLLNPISVRVGVLKFVFNFLYLLYIFSDYSFYIGAKRIPSTKTFIWTDETFVDVAQWYKTEPNNRRGKENCVVIIRQDIFLPIGSWHDIECYNPARYICQRNISGRL